MVVRLVVVLVMDNFVTAEFSADHFLGNYSVLSVAFVLTTRNLYVAARLERNTTRGFLATRKGRRLNGGPMIF